MNYAPLFERIGHLGTCVLPAKVLDNTPLTDPDTGASLLSLRQRCSCQRLCFAHVLYEFAEGLYWADVAATPDLLDAERVVLTETHLTYALAWDKRLYWRTPTQIRRLMYAQARDLAPLQPRAEPEPTTNLLPAPEVPLTVVATVEVTANDLRAALTPGASTRPQDQDAPECPDMRPLSAFDLQQGFLHAVWQTLQQHLAIAPDPTAVHALQALRALVERVQRWQQQTHQRVVNASASWCAAWQCRAWHLKLGVPESLLAESATQVAEFSSVILSKCQRFGLATFAGTAA